MQNPGDSRIDVVVRCRNEMPFVRAAIDMLTRQDPPGAKVLFIDCGSTDGSREIARSAGCEIMDWDPSAYIPGRVLNMAMHRTTSEVVAFINADAVPQDLSALNSLVIPLVRDESVVATYGRQIARPDADRHTKADYQRAFGPGGELQIRKGQFFSMAASAISRSVWTRVPFDEELRYSEDTDWTNRVGALGWKIKYIPGACFAHSHNYTLREHYKRWFGEGFADNRIYRLGPPGWLREWARPLAGSLLRDLRSGILTPRSVAIRIAQANGYYTGRRVTA